MNAKVHWIDPPEKSPVWLDYADKAVEHIYPVGDTPERPDHLKTVMRWDMKRFPEGLPEKPTTVCYLGAIEWAWSPMHSRLDSYYLSYNDDYLLMYLHLLDYGVRPCTWEWCLYAVATKAAGDARSIGFWMVHDLLKADSNTHELDPFHLISDEGALSVSDFNQIKELAWEEDDETE